MHLLLFEVTPFPERRNEYLDIAARLKAELERSGGCQHIERFRSLTAAERLLSFQLWQDEASILAWRANPAHQDVQLHGRDKVFEDYRLRVAEVLPPGSAIDPAAAILTEAVAYGRLVVAVQSSVSYLPADIRPGLRGESFASLYRADQYLHVFQPEATQLEGVLAFRATDPAHCHVAIVSRDYGLFERGEAPQERPPVVRGRR